MSADWGVVYIATGEAFVEEAILSSQSLVEQMPDISITFMTDSPVEADHIDTVVVLDDPRYDFGDQVFNLARTPYDRTVFLDTDTYVNAPFWDVFDLLDEFDLAASPNPVNYSSTRLDGDLVADIPKSFPEYNSGVVAFRQTGAVSKFFDRWRTAYRKALSQNQVHNQAAFRAALYHSDVRLATLPREYNCLYRRPGYVADTVRIFHGRLRDIDGLGADKSIDPSHAMARLNKRSDPRVYYPVGGGVKVPRASLFEKAYYSLRHRGLRGTMYRGKELLSSKLDTG